MPVMVRGPIGKGLLEFCGRGPAPTDVKLTDVKPNEDTLTDVTPADVTFTDATPTDVVPEAAGILVTTKRQKKQK